MNNLSGQLFNKSNVFYSSDRYANKSSQAHPWVAKYKQVLYSTMQIIEIKKQQNWSLVRVPFGVQAGNALQWVRENARRESRERMFFKECAKNVFALTKIWAKSVLGQIFVKRSIGSQFFRRWTRVRAQLSTTMSIFRATQLSYKDSSWQQ